jgi:cell division protein FtsB
VLVPDRKGGTQSRVQRHHERSVRRSRLFLLGGVVVSAAVLGAWFPASALYRQHASLHASSAQLQLLHKEDAALAQEKKNLSGSAEIDRIAREQYQLVGPGQTAYQVLPPANGTTSAPYAGDPGLSGPTAPSGDSELPPGTVSGSSHASQPATAGLLQRMVHALEFWR